MNIFTKLIGASPFSLLLEHTRKVHECVQLLQPLTDALLAGDYEKIEELHNEISKKEYEADLIKTSVRDRLSGAHLISVRREDMLRFLSYQDNVADSAEDYAVVLLLRKTTVPEEVTEDFRAFVLQVIRVSEHLLRLAEELSAAVESAFTGVEVTKLGPEKRPTNMVFQGLGLFPHMTVAQNVSFGLKGAEEIGQEEWKADRLARKFARHFYSIEDRLDPVTIFFLDKYCSRLGDVANSAEKTAKYLRQMVSGR